MPHVLSPSSLSAISTAWIPSSLALVKMSLKTSSPKRLAIMRTSLSVFLSSGMFPYTMLATSPVFCYPDWPRRFFGRFPEFLQPILPCISPAPTPSSSCIYPKPPSGSGEQQEEAHAAPKPTTPSFKHKFRTIFTILYIMEQFFLPYSHFITQVIYMVSVQFDLESSVDQRIQRFHNQCKHR